MLDTILCGLPKQYDENVLVGFNTSDDAGVYRIADGLALVQTVDFFTPIVDDPYSFGQIAAANSLSDVYAMGGRPATALALVCFEEKGNVEVLRQILHGGISKMMEANCTVIGGHSIRDSEIKFGYSVTGIVSPGKALTNSNAKPGDKLILTKAIGTGVISTAMKNDKAKQPWIDAAIQSMTALNRAASETISNGNFLVHALTDVTGFGLLGHIREMALGSNVTIVIEADKVPLLDGAMECVSSGQIPGGARSNRTFAESVVRYEKQLSEDMKHLLFDPQTSGGLLISIANEDTERLCDSLLAAGQLASLIGQVTPWADNAIVVE